MPWSSSTKESFAGARKRQPRPLLLRFRPPSPSTVESSSGHLWPWRHACHARGELLYRIACSYCSLACRSTAAPFIRVRRRCTTPPATLRWPNSSGATTTSTVVACSFQQAPTQPRENPVAPAPSPTSRRQGNPSCFDFDLSQCHCGVWHGHGPISQWVGVGVAGYV
jgi:hypothetical protein